MRTGHARGTCPEVQAGEPARFLEEDDELLGGCWGGDWETSEQAQGEVPPRPGCVECLVASGMTGARCGSYSSQHLGLPGPEQRNLGGLQGSVLDGWPDSGNDADAGPREGRESGRGTQ